MGARTTVIHGLTLCFLATAKLGCAGDSTPPTAITKPEPTACGAGEILQKDNTCARTGIPAENCGSRAVSDGAQRCTFIVPDAECPTGSFAVVGKTACQPVGVPAETPKPGTPAENCPQGFSPKDEGCEPVLPGESCGAGQMAIPGETSCRTVMDCGSGTWGSTPRDLLSKLSTQFVDKTYDGSAGVRDGSEARPWAKIQEGVDAASSGAAVVVAAGTYNENIQVYDHEVALWGRCPDMVNVVGTSSAYSTIDIVQQSGTEVHGITISGTASVSAIGVWASKNVVIDRIQALDHGGRGVHVDELGGVASATIEDSLIAHNHEAGIVLVGSTVSVVSTVVRDTQSKVSTLDYGRGISAQAGDVHPSTVTIESSVIDGNRDMGVFVKGATATISATVIRNTSTRENDQSSGRGIDIERDPTQATDVVVQGSFLDNNHDVGVLVIGSNATVQDTTIRGTQFRGSDSTGGWGIGAQADPAQASTLLVERSLIAGNQDIGVYALSSMATVNSTVIRDTTPSENEHTAGWGLAVQSEPAMPGVMVVHGSLVKNNGEIGVFSEGAQLTVTATEIRDTQSRQLDQDMGVGIGLEDYHGMASELTLENSLVDANRYAGILMSGAKATITGSVIRGTVSRPSDLHGGWGIGVEDDQGISSELTMVGSLLDNNTEGGLVLSASTGSVLESTIRNTQPGMDDQQEGRGISIQSRADIPSTFSLEASIVDGNQELGLFAGGADITILDSILRNTDPQTLDSISGRGVSIQDDDNGRRSTLSMTGSLVENNYNGGVYAWASDATIVNSIIRHTSAQPGSDSFGDGVTAISHAVVSVKQSVIETSARTGTTLFGANVTLENVLYSCNVVDLDQETLETNTFGYTGVSTKSQLHDAGGNVCGCGDTFGPCRVYSRGISPPPHVDPLTPSEQNTGH